MVNTQSTPAPKSAAPVGHRMIAILGLVVWAGVALLAGWLIVDDFVVDGQPLSGLGVLLGGVTLALTLLLSAPLVAYLVTKRRALLWLGVLLLTLAAIYALFILR